MACKIGVPIHAPLRTTSAPPRRTRPDQATDLDTGYAIPRGGQIRSFALGDRTPATQ